MKFIFNVIENLYVQKNQQGVYMFIFQPVRKALEEVNYQCEKISLKKPLVDDASNWCKLGDAYRKDDDYVRSSVCYHEALKKDSKCKSALFSLGEIYEVKREGISRDLEYAISFYERAADEGDEAAKNNLIKIYTRGIRNVNDWYNLGQCYTFGRNGKPTNYFIAVACFEQEIKYNSTHRDALYWLGCYYETGFGKVIKDLSKAKSYFEKGANEGHLSCKNKLIEIYSHEIKTADAWYELGEKKRIIYIPLVGLTPLPPPLIYSLIAITYYEQALICNPLHQNSLYELGLSYENGYGVVKDIAKAKSYYERGAKEDHPECEKSLIGLYSNDIKTADGLCDLGNKFFSESQYNLARLCYCKAVDLDNNHGDSLFRLGKIFEQGLGITPNYEKAEENYGKILKKEKTYTQAQAALPRLKSYGMFPLFQEMKREVKDLAQNDIQKTIQLNVVTQDQRQDKAKIKEIDDKVKRMPCP